MITALEWIGIVDGVIAGIIGLLLLRSWWVS